MRQKFIQLTSGWIPVSVMLLFTAALVLGQDRADVAPAAGAVPELAAPAANVSLYDLNDQPRLGATRDGAVSVLPLAERVELVIDVSIYPVNDEIVAGTGRLE